MIRVVLDTNIIVSAMLRPDGAPAQVFLLAIGGSLQLCLTGGIFAEYDEVLRRPRFGFDEETIRAALESLRNTALWVRTSEAVKASPDPDDDRFLECAMAAQSDYLVTGNTRHFPESWGRTRVVTARSLLNIISEPREPR